MLSLRKDLHFFLLIFYIQIRSRSNFYPKPPIRGTSLSRRKVGQSPSLSFDPQRPTNFPSPYLPSYNNTVQLFDARKMTASVAQADVGGGAWRVRWSPSETRKYDLLVACMHDGFKVIRFDATSMNGGSPGVESVLGSSKIVNRFDEHESMAYGADWSYSPLLNDGSSIVGGCSFYDHKMSLWTA